MSTKITELRKGWKLHEAYELAIQEYEKDKENIYTKNAYSWVLYDFIKLWLSSNNFKWLEEFLETLKLLDLEKWWDFDIHEILAWQFYKSIKATTDINTYKLLLFYYSKLDNHKPSDIHSYILFDVLNRYRKNENYFDLKFNFYQFLQLWWINNFQYEDYKTWEYNWKPTQSTFEKVITVLWNKIKTTKDISELWDIWDLEKILLKWMEKDLKWARLYYWKLQILKWDFEDALKNIIEIVKKEKTQFWSWHLLWEVLLKLWKNNLYFSALSKALRCWKDDNFLNNLREEYIHELLKRNLNDEANIELNIILNNKKENNIKNSDSIENLVNSSWYNASIIWKNTHFYMQNIWEIEDFIYSDILEQYILVEHINREKSIVNFINKYREKWFFKSKTIEKYKLQKWNVLKVKLEKVDWEYYNLYKIFKEKWNINDIFEFKRIFIDYINRDKKIINFIQNYTYWFFSYKWFEQIIENIKTWEFLEVVFWSSKWEYYNLLDCKKSTIIDDENYKKEFSWKINIKEGNSFWFVDDIFIWNIENIKNWDEISWLAVKSYNKKKGNITWKAI